MFHVAVGCKSTQFLRKEKSPVLALFMLRDVNWDQTRDDRFVLQFLGIGGLACDCGFAFFRYTCPACGKTVDGRDPKNPNCEECGLRVCTCGACGCAAK